MKKILILEGGFNEEHKVSLSTAKEVKKILKRNKVNYKSLLVNPKTFKNKIKKYNNQYICFNALHGPFGEDGQIQKILKINKLKYTHSSINASINCFSKDKSKKIVKKSKIPTPRFIKIKANKINEEFLYKIMKKFNKFIIKPNESGSSFGIKIVRNKNELKKFIEIIKSYKKIIKNHKSLIVEEFIDGKELTVSVLKIKNKPQPLDVTEILSKNIFFDYKSKYTKGFSKHILPAKIPKNIYNKCLKFALLAHKNLGCNSISRSDFIFDQKNKKLFFLETNTQPGLTPISLVPEQANFKNISFENLVFKLLENINEK